MRNESVDTALNDIVTRTPGLMGGRPVLRGTRVPVETLFEHLADGMSIEEILDEWPSLDREDVVTLLRTLPTIFGVKPD